MSERALAGYRLPLLAAILLLAAFLRFWQLDTLPPGLYHDEAYNGLDALALLRDATFPQFYEGWELYAADAHAGRPAEPTTRPIFFEGNYGREPLHIYLMAASIQLLGATPLAIRAVPAVAGVLAVLTTYLAAGALLNDRARGHDLRPLIAAFTMAVLYPALTFSRFGIRAMLFVPLETLCVYAFWRGLDAFRKGGRPHRRQWLWWPLAGFFLGAGLYTYAAARLFPFLFLVFVPLWLWRARPGRAGWVAMLSMAATAVLIAAPLLLYFARYPYFLVFRTAFVANKGRGAVPGRPWETWFNNIGRVLAGLVWRGESHLRHNLPGRPYLDAGQALLFGAGLWPVFKERNGRHFFLFLWLVFMLLPSVLSGDAPHFGRMTGAAPVLAILVAEGAHTLWQALGRRRAVAVGVTAVLLLSATLTFRDYFGRYAAHPQLPADFYTADWSVGRYAADVTPESDVYLVPPQAEMATIYYALAGRTARWRSFGADSTLLPTGREGRPLQYIIRGDHPQILERLQRFFPSGTFSRPERDIERLAVTAGAIRQPPGIPAAARWGDEIALERWSQSVVDSSLTVTLTWRALVTPTADYTAFVHVRTEDAPPSAQFDRPPAGYPTSEWRPGEIVVDIFVISLPGDLAGGPYRLETGFYTLMVEEVIPLGPPVLLDSISFP